MTRQPQHRPRLQRGIALITSLLILVIVALLAVSMYRSFGLQEKIAGNTLEKQRSLQAAESALQYGEWWIARGSGGGGLACSGVFSANDQTAMKICNVPMSIVTSSTLPWAVRGNYQPPSMTVQSGGGLNTGSTGIANDINYATMPSVYVSYLGLAPDGKTMLYQVTGAGYGGTTATASVVQSTYAMKFSVTDIGQP
ncbi:pilus assembly protein PilX [Variovorax sp. PAMC28562]|uniref:pilus assembly PilX family protein n=1 Tax=Variovorax sp. PAMC28562 TaxID=2762323 RepID=UPI00164D5F77|nr:PilX N-terminal domain-containing pilus assembly protein [Variovorax sp. PAMC28562]QNK74580.1 pilus assembly protein PilX [Variovorax sp. PAMC28562]